MHTLEQILDPFFGQANGDIWKADDSSAFGSEFRNIDHLAIQGGSQGKVKSFGIDLDIFRRVSGLAARILMRRELEEVSWLGGAEDDSCLGNLTH